MKYVFVCGMPRSGTTILAKEIGRFRDCTGFENTGANMDEGQYLQDVYPTEAACGGAGRFGFAPQAHLTENSPLLTPANVSQMVRSWEGYWDRNKTIRVEKTPCNILKTRFLQAAFPNAYFIVIKRHPVCVSLAVQKWSRTPMHDLFKHWLRCHEIFDEDKKYLKHVYELSYEDYIKDPRKHLEEFARFIGTEFSALAADVADVHNKKYFDRWARMLRDSAFKSYYRRVAEMYERKFQEHGYSLAPGIDARGLWPERGGRLRGVLDPLRYLAADVYCVFWRADLALRIWAHRVIDDYCSPRVQAILYRRRAKVT